MFRSRSNNDLLSIDNDGSKSPDTASLHSLPATSSFPDWNSSNSAGGSANFAEDFSNAFESISPAFSPSQVSPIGSPPETVSKYWTPIAIFLPSIGATCKTYHMFRGCYVVP